MVNALDEVKELFGAIFALEEQISRLQPFVAFVQFRPRLPAVSLRTLLLQRFALIHQVFLFLLFFLLFLLLLIFLLFLFLLLFFLGSGPEGDDVL